MFPAANMSNSLTSISEEAKTYDYHTTTLCPHLFTPFSPPHLQQPILLKPKKKRSQPGNPDPDAEVIALSPKSLMETNRFVCEICNKGFQRDQNLQLHRRGHNLPWKLRQRSSSKDQVVRKRVYVCPETSCVHHHPSKALGDLTGIKKHFSRKHGEKKWKCEKCSKRYAVHSDWKAHTKTCGTKEYRCDCGTLFSRKDSFITHRAFCDALAEESARLMANSADHYNPHHQPPLLPFSTWNPLNPPNPNPNPSPSPSPSLMDSLHQLHSTTTTTTTTITFSPPELSATTLLQKATAMGPLPSCNTTAIISDRISNIGTTMMASYDGGGFCFDSWQKGDCLTRDFLGVAAVEAGQDELFPLARPGMEMVAAAPPPPPCENEESSLPVVAAATFGFRPATKGWCSDC